MATALRKSKSFQKNLFFSIGGIFLLFTLFIHFHNFLLFVPVGTIKV
jgi:hypothetical protein